MNWYDHQMHNDAINAYVFVNLMLFTKENNIPDILSDDKCYSARQLLKEFHFLPRDVMHPR